MLTEVSTSDSLRYLLKKMGEEVLPKTRDGSIKEKEETKKLFEEEASKLLMAMGIETHSPLEAATSARFRPYALVMIDKITKEYNCTAPSEKALCDVIINSYIKVLAFTARLNGTVEANDYISENKTKFLAMLSKELDRANRQFLSALGMMRQIKSPSFEINVKAKTAFVSQNQQVNAYNNQPQSQNETIEPK